MNLSRFVIVLALLGLPFASALAQLSGPNPGNAGGTHTYTWSGGSISSPVWTVSNGTKGASSSTSVTVTWNSNATTGTIALVDGWTFKGSLTVNLKPSSPTAATATNGSPNSFTANWSGSPTATSFSLDVSTSSTFASSVTTTNNLSGSSYTVTGLLPGTTYYYRVRGVNTNGSSLNSATITSYTGPQANTASSVSSTGLTANWTSVSGASSYTLQYSTDINFVSSVTTVNSITTTSRIITGLTIGTNYYYRVQYVKSGISSPYSSTVHAPTITAAPVGLAGSGQTETSFTASWNTVPAAATYSVDVSKSTSFTPLVYNGLSAASNSLVINGLESGQTYYFRVRGVNSSGSSANSATSPAVTILTGPPTNIIATPNSYGLNLIWTAALGATAYTIDVATDAGFISKVVPYDNFSVTGTSLNVNGLKPSTTYWLRMRSVRSGGHSSYTSSLQVTTLGQFANLNENYVVAYTLMTGNYQSNASLEALPREDVSQTVQYFDGLGRIKQTVMTQASPLKADIIQPVAYDEFGREQFKYLPFVPGQATGWFRSNTVGTPATYTNSDHFAFYQNGATDKVQDDARPFSENIFEASPLSRVVKSFGPGTDWYINNKATETNLEVNVDGTATGQERIINWEIVNGLPVRKTGSNGGFYPTGQVMVNVVVDEHGNPVRTYTDAFGQTILKKVFATGSKSDLNNALNWTQTYYVYDDFGRLRFVLQPELVKTLVQSGANPLAVDLGKFAFIYRYDRFGRMVTKKVPGADSVLMVYDKRDRLVLTQDGNQRVLATKYWSFTKYDELNRPIMTGIKDTTANLSQLQMQGVVDAYYNNMTTTTWRKWGETYIGNVAGNVHGYSNKSYPVRTGGASEVDVNKYLTVSYYDNYDFRSLWYGTYTYADENLSGVINGTTYHQLDTENTRVVGQITGTKTKVLDGGVTGGYTWLKGISYYDDKYRVIQTIADNYKGGTDRVTNVYDFVGKVLETKSTHTELDVSWRDVVSVKQEGNKLISVSGPPQWGFGCASVQQLAAGQDGWFEFLVTETTTSKIIGFNDSNSGGTSYTDINYAFLLYFSTLYIQENTSIRATVSGIVPGDVLRIERIGSTITFKRNGVVIPTSTLAPSTTALFIDNSFHVGGNTIAGIRATFATTTSTITRRYEYDHAGRLLKTWHKLNSGTEILLALNEYNELGELVDKKLHSTVSNGSNAKQSVDYRYNIRGWLTKMNEADVSMLASGDAVKDLFGFELAYNNDLGTGNSSNLQYNGNISAMKWSNALSLGSIKENAYNYTYDPLNRLKTATFRERASSWSTPANNAFVESGLNYDLNGNITSLTRNDKRATGWMDNLGYIYTGNQLMRVTDTGDPFAGFIDGQPAAADDYKYDPNGNMTHDLNKGIGTSLTDNTNLITYNYLNLPETVTKGNNNIRYIYDATGRKLTQVTTFGGQQKQEDYAGEFQYENDQLQFISHEEGRIVMASTKTIFTHDGESTTGITAATSALAAVTVNTQKYVRATASGTTAKQGMFPIGGTIAVQGGERYRIRAKGYRTGANSVHLYIRTNSTDLDWPGSALANGAVAEASAEQIVTIPAGHTTMQVGVVWNTVTNGQQLFLNDFEIVKLTVNSTPEYQYNLKDHLGNTRLTFTSKVEVESNTATLEAANINAERAEFLRYDNAKRVNAYLFDRTNGVAPTTTPGFSVRLSGGTNEVYGLARSLSVMPGDVINAEVYAKYIDPAAINSGTPAGQALLALLAQIAANTAGVVVDGALFSSSTSSFPMNYTTLVNKTDVGGPRAYLNWLIFDRNYGFITGGFKQLSTTPKETGNDVAHELMASPTITITQPGYVYIYLSNESMQPPNASSVPVEVYFDHFKVTHTKSPVVQMDDYYPFGLTFNSYSRENSVPNKFKFGGKEEQTDLALNTIDWGWRQYDPAIARWNVVDQWAAKYHTTSPYAFVQNNPISNREIDGRYFDERNEKKAAKIEAKAEKRADKLEAKANKLEAKGKESGDLRQRSAELRQSGQDVKDMRNDANTEYRYAKLGGKESKQLGLAGPSTTLTGQNSRGDNVVTMFTESNMGNKVHESRHGGQNARGEYNIATEAGYGVADEVSAYRAQYSWSGRLQYRDEPANDVMMQRLLSGQDPTTGTITNINQITPNVVNSMVDPGFHPIYPPRDGQGNLIIPLDVWNRN